jgi:DNA-binding NtrC family response regulator
MEADAVQQQAPGAGQSLRPGTGAEQDMARRYALLFDGDLFFAVKVADTLKHAGYTTRTVRRAGDFVAALADERPVVALVNAGNSGRPAAPGNRAADAPAEWRAAVEAAHAAGVPVVVYAPHVDTETQAAARTAGATSIIANSKLAADLPAVVARALRRGSASESDTSAAATGARDAAGNGERHTPPDATDAHQ